MPTDTSSESVSNYRPAAQSFADDGSCAGGARRQSGSESQCASARLSRSQRWFFWSMLAAVLAGGCGFVYKLIQFAHEALESETASFAVAPIVVYMLVALGFVCLFTWGLLRGQWSDVEGPKQRLLENEERYEQRGI